MRIGCCVSMLADAQDTLGRRYMKELAAYGYDYVELPLAQVMELDEKSFDELLLELLKYNIPCDCCNNFFPKEIRLTGADICMTRIEAYIQKSITRAARLGAKIIVFGSAGAKNIPDGFLYQQAFLQIVEALKIVDRYAIQNNIIVVIEPLNHLESNLILNIHDGEQLLHAADFKNIKLLVDYYHFMVERDSFKDLQKSMPDIVHAHFAEPDGRAFPTEIKAEYVHFLQTFQQNHYEGRLSVEAISNDPYEDMKRFVGLFGTLTCGTS